MRKYAVILATVIVIFFIHACATVTKDQMRNPDSMIKDEELISLPTVIELARTAYNAGCVRSYIKRGIKGKFDQCRKDADQFVSEEVTGIIKADPIKRKHQ